jgi:hypothetical protein
MQVYVRAKPLTVSEKAAGLQPVVRCESDHRVSLTFQGAPKVAACTLAVAFELYHHLTASHLRISCCYLIWRP